MIIISNESAWQPKEKVMRKKYGFWKFMGDIFMTLITGGLWLIWIFVREMRGLRTA